ncbi:MAG: transposase [Eubacterium sp.]|nr:transposase [Eubacterium sp.]
MLASGSCLLSDISDRLSESAKKKNTIDRLSKHLQAGVPEDALNSYLTIVKNSVPSEPIVHIDDSDVVKPSGQHFESLGRVRDGSKSSATKNVYENGYLVTEACVLNSKNDPISFFSHIHSSHEKEYRSANTITYQAIERGAALFDNALFVMDRGYDDNKIFTLMHSKSQSFVIRLKTNRKLYYKNEFMPVTAIRDSHKGKIKMDAYYHGEHHEAYVSFVPVLVTEERIPTTLVLVYNLGELPMMLLTNRPVVGRDDAIHIARAYFSRWRIEEYFRCKKQQYKFEDFRVRKLSAMNSLNFCLTLCMAFLTFINDKPEHSRLKYAIFKAAESLRVKVAFNHYRISTGIANTLRHAQTGVRDWHKPRRRSRRNLQLMLSFD